MEQRLAEWFQARLGRATASRFKDVMARLKSGEPAQARSDYLIEVAAERLTGMPTEHPVNKFMQWGTDMEPAAREAYCQRTALIVDEVGFIPHASLMAGCSPDGIIDIEGVLEIKCPTSNTHIETMSNGMPARHQAQVQGAMWILGAEWADFVSYDPRMPPGLQLYIQRIERNDIFITKLASEVEIFLAEVDAMIAILRSKAQ
jgi:hypothetical protein